MINNVKQTLSRSHDAIVVAHPVLVATISGDESPGNLAPDSGTVDVALAPFGDTYSLDPQHLALETLPAVHGTLDVAGTAHKVVVHRV